METPSSEPKKETLHPDAYAFIEYQNDSIPTNNRKDPEVKRTTVWNSRNAAAPKLVEHKGHDYIRTSRPGAQRFDPDHKANFGELLWVSVNQEMSDAEELQKALNEKIQIQGIVVKYP